MGYLEVRASGSESWKQACQDIIAKLKQKGFAKGQVWTIDLKHNGSNSGCAPIISAHWTGDPVGANANTSYIDFEMDDVRKNWDGHYKWADEKAEALRKAGKRMISITSITKNNNSGMTVLFFEH